MQAIYAKNIEGVKTVLDEMAADMEILNYNIRESNASDEAKKHNIQLITQLRQNVYDTIKKLQ